jgi:hypothetical protein
MLRNLEHEADVVVEHLEGCQDRGEPLVEPHVHDGTDDLAHLPDGAGAGELIGDLAAAGGLAGGRRRRCGLLHLGRRGGGVAGGAVKEESSGRRAVWERCAGARGRGGGTEAGGGAEDGGEGSAHRHGRRRGVRI